jgi:hypothetical protein
VPGVLAALITVWPLIRPADRDKVANAIRYLARYLVRTGSTDDRGVLTWPPASVRNPDRMPKRRQAWCYGAPGVAWQLAEAGRVLNDPEMRAYGIASITSLCQAWDDDYYLTPRQDSSWLGFCHGAAGILAVTRAFGHKLGLGHADRLAQHLSHLLSREAASIHDLASADIHVEGWQTPLGLGALEEVRHRGLGAG